MSNLRKIGKYRLAYVIFAAFTLAIGSVSCGGEGDKKNPPSDDTIRPKPPEKDDTRPGVPKDRIGADIDLSLSSKLPSAECLEKYPLELSEPKDFDEVVFDGLADVENATKVNTSLLGVGVDIRAVKRARGLYFYVELPLDTELKLKFQGSRYAQNELFFEATYQLDLRSDGSVWEHSLGKKDRLQKKGRASKAFSTVTSSGRIYEILVHDSRIKDVASSSYFWVQSRLKRNTGEAVDLPKVFDSFYPVQGALKSYYGCTEWDRSRPGDHLQIISYYDELTDESPEFGDEDFTGFKRIITSLYKEMGWNTSDLPTLIHLAPYDKITDFSGHIEKKVKVTMDSGLLKGKAPVLEAQRIAWQSLVVQMAYARAVNTLKFSNEIAARLYAYTVHYKFVTSALGRMFYFNHLQLPSQYYWGKGFDPELHDELKILGMFLGETFDVESMNATLQLVNEAAPESVLELGDILLEMTASRLGRFGDRLTVILRNIRSNQLAFSTLSLFDRDQDGLFDSFEALIGSVYNKKDSDGDLWNDGAEFFAKRNPASSDDYPSRLAVDGFVGDWFKILPGKVFFNEYVNKECPSTSDITKFSAVYTGRSIVVFGSSFESPVPADDRTSKWFLDVRLPDINGLIQLTKDPSRPGVLLVEADLYGEKKEYDYYRNITEASEGIEWEVPLVELGVSGFESTDLAMQIKLTTTLTEKKSDVCDESGWFVPYKF